MDTRGDPLASYSGILSRILDGIHWDTRRGPLASYSGGILGGIRWRATLGYSAILGGIHRPAALAGYSAGSTGELLWDTQRDTRRDSLVGCSGGILGGIHWRAALAGYSAGFTGTGEQLWRDTTGEPLAGYSAGSTGRSGGILGGIHWRAPERDTRRDPLAGCSGGILGGIHWRAALAGYSAGFTGTGEQLWRDTTGEPLWRDTRRDPLAALAGYSAGFTGERQSGILGGIHWRAALAGYSAGFTGTGEQLWRDTTGEPLWRDTRRDPLAALAGYLAGFTGERQSGILGGIHWRAALAGYWAGSTGEQLWRDARRDPLASCSGGLGGIHWRAALAGYWVGAWCRSIANADSNIKSSNPFLSGGEQPTHSLPSNKKNLHAQLVRRRPWFARPRSPCRRGVAARRGWRATAGRCWTRRCSPSTRSWGATTGCPPPP